ncbi:aspartyl-phosphate phosphatase Spo0E family protein [Aquibacillus albus]|uniref:Spo0E family sporulation regulatory protein-aspartic acid phosphatase n=1 Tax=Aquibacillus albus TaxID=1168171 RepID=A0ABS2N565_9BACI|nr:aspartyl-phosphate phosphatase Spo0E family protein [Aquibacillus albus]MBM7573292.1 hypothetical protein [Aquibacillus albus]
MDKKLYLLKRIERCRAEMIELSSMNDLTSDAVIAASAELDFLLNEFDRVNELNPT